MKNSITEELKKIGITPTSEDSSSLRFSIKGYTVDYFEENRECLAFLSNATMDAVDLYGKLEFTKDGDPAPDYKYVLKISKGVGPKQIVEWISRKIKNPVRDTTVLKDFKIRIMSLGYEWLKPERIVNVSSEFEEYNKTKIEQLAINYNDVITDDHILVQIKTLLDQPGNPQFYVLKTIALHNDNVNISEEEFDIKDLENIIKRTMMFRYMELEEVASGGDEDKIRARSEKL